jgi:hypothetical protein
MSLPAAPKKALKLLPGPQMCSTATVQLSYTALSLTVSRPGKYQAHRLLLPLAANRCQSYREHSSAAWHCVAGELA